MYVPIDIYVREILDRHGGKLPEARTAQHFNYAIKKICETAGLTEVLVYEDNVAGDVVMKKVRKCDIISSHTGRRSYVTNQFKRGNGVDKIQPVTGHQSISCLLKYNKQSKKDNARMLAAVAS